MKRFFLVIVALFPVLVRAQAIGWGNGGGISAGADVSATVSKGSATGAISRSLAARLGDVANVLDYGASGSGQTTTGSMANGSYSLTVADAKDFAAGERILARPEKPKDDEPRKPGAYDEMFASPRPRKAEGSRT